VSEPITVQENESTIVAIVDHIAPIAVYKKNKSQSAQGPRNKRFLVPTVSEWPKKKKEKKSNWDTF